MARIHAIDLTGFGAHEGLATSRMARSLARDLIERAHAGGPRVVFTTGHREAHRIRDWIGEDVDVLPHGPRGDLTPTQRSLEPELVICPLDDTGPWRTVTTQPRIAVVEDALALDRPELFEADELETVQRGLATLAGASAVATYTGRIRDRLLAHLALDAERVTLVPPSFRAHAQPAPFLPVMPPYLVYVVEGRGRERDRLAEVMRAIWAERPELKLVVVGDEASGVTGELRAVAPTGVYDLRAGSGREVAAVYASAEAALLVARHEASGVAVIDALGYGCPVMCAEGGPAETIAGHACITVPDDGRRWAAAIARELPGRRSELVAAGREIASSLDEPGTLRAWRELIDRTCVRSDRSPALDLATLGRELGVWAATVAELEDRLRPLREAEERLTSFLRRVDENQHAIDRPLPLGVGLMRRTLRLHWRTAHRIGRLQVFDPLRPKIGWPHQHEPRTLRMPGPLPPPSDAPGIAIVTPSYRQAVYLERTIRSVVDQGYPALQYVVQDGGSDDGSQEVIERYRSILHHAESRPDEGQAHAINLGFEKTDAEIMAYLNSDDLLLPGTLAYVARYFQEHPDVDVVYGHRILVDTDDLEIGRWIMPPHRDDVLVVADYVPQETLFWRRRVWDAIGGAVNEERKFAMDWDLLLRLQDAGARFVRLPRFLGAFRVHAEQKTIAHLDVGQDEMDLLRRRYGGPTEWKDIQRALRPYFRRHILLHALYRLKLVRY